MNKKCLECELEKPLDNFNVNKGYYRNICKLCEKDKRRSHYTFIICENRRGCDKIKSLYKSTTFM